LGFGGAVPRGFNLGLSLNQLTFADLAWLLGSVEYILPRMKMADDELPKVDERRANRPYPRIAGT